MDASCQVEMPAFFAPYLAKQRVHVKREPLTPAEKQLAANKRSKESKKRTKEKARALQEALGALK